MAGHRDRLLALAGSVNETARMARVSVSLTLVVALYLALTLLTATDENIVQNTTVVLPQLGTGVSIKLSYFLAPPVFVYLHGQTLFLLVVLVRKIRRFEESIARLYPDDPHAAAECRDWLSAASFVQGLLGTGGFARVGRGLTWLSTTVIPLMLLLLIDVSFLRHQSIGTTLVHHLCFCTALVSVWMFWQYVRGPGTEFPWRDLFGLFHLRRYNDRVGTLAVVARAVGKLTARTVPAGGVVACLFVFAWPVGFPSPSFHVLDDVLCPLSLWNGTCRTINLRGANLKGANLWGANLTGADLRGADLHGVGLSRANLRGADLVEASLGEAYLREANLVEAKLSSADLRTANLVGANLQKADLRGADLGQANLKDAGLREANLLYADLTGANLKNAILRETYLVGTILEKANLCKANLTDANLTGANLTGANLTGANLTGAILEHANLRDVLGLDQTQLDLACGDDRTMLPATLTVQTCSELRSPGQQYIMPDQPCEANPSRP